MNINIEMPKIGFGSLNNPYAIYIIINQGINPIILRIILGFSKIISA